MAEHLTASRLTKALLIGTGLLVISAWAGLSLGSTRLSFAELIEMDILLLARLPRVVFAGIVGAALACAGAVFQAVLRNPLADPYILGISGGAALGGSLMVALGIMSALGTPAAAFAGGLGALAVILLAARIMPNSSTLSTYVLLLTGVIFNAFASAVIMFLKSVLSAQKAQELLFYLMGSLSVEGIGLTHTLGVVLVVGLLLGGQLAYARSLNALTLGDESAQALGVDARRTRMVTVVLASLAVAVAVAYTGLIGFVGLVVPHAMRLAFGSDHRVLLPMCILGGASFLILADTIARVSFMAISTTLPVGVITAFLGAPIFFYFLRRNLLKTRII
ncbi:iron ABC transporter permease [Microvenator marinus]|uniref:Iron ABC transporter permease n=1 Tax=Microvenator marinus TaxID=2600177 RepID=A0A5B8XRT2_9DELT|nr:iron ABC transporter permease [Microvenator marinus]QED28360.1 iron ABC transporter permease [Microvenator marinus]